MCQFIPSIKTMAVTVAQIRDAIYHNGQNFSIPRELSDMHALKLVRAYYRTGQLDVRDWLSAARFTPHTIWDGDWDSFWDWEPTESQIGLVRQMLSNLTPIEVADIYVKRLNYQLQHLTYKIFGPQVDAAQLHELARPSAALIGFDLLTRITHDPDGIMAGLFARETTRTPLTPEGVQQGWKEVLSRSGVHLAYACYDAMLSRANDDFSTKLPARGLVLKAYANEPTNPIFQTYALYLSFIIDNALRHLPPVLTVEQVDESNPILAPVLVPLSLDFLKLDTFSSQGLEHLTSLYAGRPPTDEEVMLRLSMV